MSIIKSISYDQEEIIENILNLHVPDKKIDCDPTYSKGNFYKSGVITPPIYKFDLNPRTSDTIKSCATSLPIDDNSINCLMFDPPFIMGSGPSEKNPNEGSNLTSKRFGMFKNPNELMKFYYAAISEFYRVISSNGILIFKCQDCVVAGKNLMSHVLIMNMAYKIGFYPKDLFILLAKSRMISGKVKNQQHARKFHSYFWVFEKAISKIDYNSFL